VNGQEPVSNPRKQSGNQTLGNLSDWLTEHNRSGRPAPTYTVSPAA